METIDRFATAKLAIGLSPRTVTWYEWMIGDYVAWTEGEGLNKLATETVERFLAAKRRIGGAPSSIASYYRALRVYFAWLVQRGYLDADANPIRDIEPPRVPRKRMKYVTVEHFHQLYHSIDGDTWTDARDRAMLPILFYSGLRIGELLALCPEDIHPRDRLITVNRGKGGHQRIVPCAPVVGTRVQEYLQLRPACGIRRLWVSNDGYGGVRGALTIDGVRQMLRRRCRRLGIAYMNPHAFRHGYAMALLNAGMDLSAVSAALGHTSTKTTEEVYAHWLTGGLQREYDEALKRL